MSIRLAIHVGPHKTGSTSVQRACHAARDTLAESGVWYPPSVPGAEWPDQHADIWLMMRAGCDEAIWEWLDVAHAEATRRGCDAILISSENFSVPRTRRALARLMARWRRTARGDARLLYVRRDLVELACSRAMSHLTGETGFFFGQRYDLRHWARCFAINQVRQERWFRRRSARFISLTAGPRASLAARILEAATDRPFPELSTGDDNDTIKRVANAKAMFSYGLRVMKFYATGEGANTPAAFASVLPMFTTTGLDEAAFATLAEGFRTGVTRDVRQGIDDFRRLSPLARQWCVWFEKTDIR